jgi:mRNA-degrading endonuclease toxin of MazEF toxin-antitoxin module
VSKEVRRGDIWVVDRAPGRGCEQAGMRPAAVVQTDAANLSPRYPSTIVLTVSTRGETVPFHVSIDASDRNGLKKDPS